MDTEPTIPLTPPSTASTPSESPITPHAKASAVPRVRWAGIVWGVLFAVAAASALWTLGDPTRRAILHERLLTLQPVSVEPGWVVAAVILAGGVLLLVLSGVELLGRARRRTPAER